MKKKLAVLLCILVMLPAIINLSITSWYASDVQYFIENYCINKAKPEIKCDGKCFLKENFNTSQQTPKDAVLSIINTKSSLFLFLKLRQELVYSSTNVYALSFIDPQYITQSFIQDIFQPPKAY